jgi:hypothetical protein
MVAAVVRIAATLAVLILSACGEEAGVFVELKTDLVPEAEFVRIVARLETSTGAVIERETEARYGEEFSRGRRVAEFVGIPNGRSTVTIEISSPWGAPLASRAIAFDFQSSRGVQVLITRTCAHVDCPRSGDSPDATECLGARCVPPSCSAPTDAACGEPDCERNENCNRRASCAESVCDDGVCFVSILEGACGAEAWCDPSSGCVQRMSIADGGVPDASVEGCTADAECDDAIGCTIDRCTDRVCNHTTDDALCTEASGGTCVVDFGCQYPGCTPESCVAANGCEVARCNGSECVMEPACTEGQICCGGACAPAGCDDANGCTIDSCGAGGCEHAPNDGLVCGTTLYTDWTPCDGFSDVCDETGTRTRIRMDPICMGGTCRSGETLETEACPRATAGIVCADPVVGTFGTCFFGDTCDDSAVQTRPRTDYTCAAGVCTPTESTESMECTRVTDGLTCHDLDTCVRGSCSGGFCRGTGCGSGRRCCGDGRCACTGCICDL